jgi:hypothetical protein
MDDIEYENCGVKVPTIVVGPDGSGPGTAAEKVVIVGAGEERTITTFPSKAVPVPAMVYIDPTVGAVATAAKVNPATSGADHV